MDAALQALLRPRSVALIGASGDPGKTSGRPLAYLRKHGFAGRIYPVNPKLAHIDDLRCYPDIASLPEVPDVAMLLLGAQRTEAAVRELAALGTQAAIVLASGYAETGEQGGQRQRQLREAAGAMRLLGPNTIGLVNLTDGIMLSPSGALEMSGLQPGPIGVISQSGGILGALLSRASARGIGLSKLVATSNEVDLELSDFIDALVDDPATQVLALYIETVRDVPRFRAACARARAAGKPIVAFKVGRSEAGARAAVSHTGAMASADRMVDALFAQTGVQRAPSLSGLLDMVAALAAGRRYGGPRVAVLTSTGGAGTLVCDSLGLADFALPAPDPVTAQALRDLQTGEEAVLDRNPIDVTLAGLQPQLLRGVIRCLQDSPSYDALVVIAGSSALAQPELMANAIGECLPRSDKPVLAYVSPHAPQVLAALTRRGVPAYADTDALALGLGALRQQARAQRPETEAPGLPTCAMPEVLAQAHGSLNEAQAKQVFAAFGIPAVPEVVVHSAEAAQAAAQRLVEQGGGAGARFALKLLSAEITHKSDVGGVQLGLQADQVAQAWHDVSARVQAHTGAAPTACVLQEMASGVEIILGMHRDPLGSAVMVGLGGVSAELFGDTALAMLPAQGGLAPAQALALLQSLKSWPLLDGWRGRPKADVPALVQAVVAFSGMVAQLGERLQEAEINPLFVRPMGQGVLAADGVLVLS
ncbi:MAG: hypothetical protein RIQ97_2676 [Pseudomonadota bacterium]|jgi:acyl-CoA synthetase (NDP forming)